jgi:hypothetical protein
MAPGGPDACSILAADCATIDRNVSFHQRPKPTRIDRAQ